MIPSGAVMALMGGSTPPFGPKSLPGLVLWVRAGTGITQVANAVSQWDDQSGASHNLIQTAIPASKPTLQADGTVLFDGVDDFLRAVGGFALIQPTTVYLKCKQVTWTVGDRLSDGELNNSGAILTVGVTPQIGLFAGSSFGTDGNLAVGAYGTVIVVFNGATSVLQVDGNAPATGNAGASNMGGFVLGANGVASVFGNIQVKEAAVYSTAHDAATRARLLAYFNNV